MGAYLQYHLSQPPSGGSAATPSGDSSPEELPDDQKKPFPSAKRRPAAQPSRGGDYPSHRPGNPPRSRLSYGCGRDWNRRERCFPLAGATVTWQSYAGQRDALRRELPISGRNRSNPYAGDSWEEEADFHPATHLLAELLEDLSSEWGATITTFTLC